MSLIDWVVYALFSLLMLRFAIEVPRIWRGDVDRSSAVPVTWPWGGISWRAVIRAGPAALIGGLTLIVGFPALLIAPEKANGAFARPLIVVLPVLGLFTLSLVAVLCVALLNRPRFLVAPHLRGAPGALAERAARGNERRRVRERRR